MGYGCLLGRDADLQAVRDAAVGAADTHAETPLAAALRDLDDQHVPALRELGLGLVLARAHAA